MSDQDEYAGYGVKRARRMRITAWVAILSLVLVGGGATVLSLIFG
ncbi:hypothetical protein ACQ143_14010 [Microbacterium sp. MC2]